MFDIDNIFEEVWKEESTASQSDLTYTEGRLDYHFPEEFRELYMKDDGFRARTGELYLDIWNLDEITAWKNRNRFAR